MQMIREPEKLLWLVREVDSRSKARMDRDKEENRRSRLLVKYLEELLRKKNEKGKKKRDKEKQDRNEEPKDEDRGDEPSWAKLYKEAADHRFEDMCNAMLKATQRVEEEWVRLARQRRELRKRADERRKEAEEKRKRKEEEEKRKRKRKREEDEEDEDEDNEDEENKDEENGDEEEQDNEKQD